MLVLITILCMARDIGFFQRSSLTSLRSLSDRIACLSSQFHRGDGDRAPVFLCNIVEYHATSQRLSSGLELLPVVGASIIIFSRGKGFDYGDCGPTLPRNMVGNHACCMLPVGMQVQHKSSSVPHACTMDDGQINIIHTSLHMVDKASLTYMFLLTM